MEKKTESIQMALMFQSDYAGSFEAVLNDAESKFTNTNIKPTIIPIPSDAPSEIPRLQIEINTESKKTLINFSKSRADIISRDVKELNEIELGAFIQIALGLGVKIGRIGLIRKTKFTDVDYTFIREKLHIDQTLIEKDGDILEGTYRINKKTTLDEHDCNNITVLNLQRDGGGQPWILLSRDVNTCQTSNLGIDTQEGVEAILSLLKPEVDKDEIMN